MLGTDRRVSDYRSNHSRYRLMTNQNIRNIDPEKLTAERLNGYAALFGCIALVGAYATTGQIIPGFV